MPPEIRSDTGPAEVIVRNGKVATQDDRRPFAQALAIRDGQFIAVGADQDVLECRGDRTQVIDVGGRTVTPGLNDSHLHPGSPHYELMILKGFRAILPFGVG